MFWLCLVAGNIGSQSIGQLIQARTESKLWQIHRQGRRGRRPGHSGSKKSLRRVSLFINLGHFLPRIDATRKSICHTQTASWAIPMKRRVALTKRGAEPTRAWHSPLAMEWSGVFLLKFECSKANSNRVNQCLLLKFECRKANLDCMLHEKRWIGMKIPYCTREFEMDKSHLVAPPEN
jgi:hypothetical protein